MGSGFKDFAAGDVLTANDVDGYLMRQSVMTFADASARDSALSGVLDEGMMAYLEDTNATTYYDGSAWKDVRGIGGGAAVRTLGSFVGGDVLQAAELNAIGAWITFTPSWTNLTVGNGVQSAQYVVVNEMCWVHGYIDFGSTSAITGGVVMTPPVAIDTSRTMNYHNIGSGSFLKGSVWPFTVLNFGGDFYFYVEQANATDVVLTNLNATRPAAYDSATWVSYQMAYPV